MRRVSGEQPIFSAIEWVASHSEPYSGRCSENIRTARSRTSCENLFLRAIAPSSQEMEPPANPAWFTENIKASQSAGDDRASHWKRKAFMERETGFEPATLSLGS